ncbi:MAG: BTAD domain-containing putative transcriptional regulator [Nocardioidaceae bacterium]
MLRIRLIGKPGFELEGQPVAGPRGHKTWALLGRLARSADPVSREVLVGELFSEADDPFGALRWSLAELRRRAHLAGAFEGNPLSMPTSAEVRLDVHEVTSGAVPEEIPEGQFLEGIQVRGSPGFESWLLIERQRVDAEVLSALRQATLRALAGRAFDKAVTLASAMVRRAPWEEGSHVLLVKALAASGDVSAAARQASTSETMFVDELGLDATPAIRAAARPAVSAPIPGVSARATALSLCEAGLAALSAGASDAGIECLRSATAAAETSGDKDVLGRCLLELGTALVHAVQGYDDEGSVLLGAAVELATAVGAHGTAAKALAELGYVDVLAGRRSSAGDYLRAAGELAVDDPTLLAAVVSFEAMNLSDWGKLQVGADRFAEAVELSRSAGAARREVFSLGLGARTLFVQGRLVEAKAWARESRALAEREHWTAFRPWPDAWLAHARLASGENPQVVRGDAEASFALARQLKDPCWEGVTAKSVGLTHLAEHDHEAALEWMANAGTMCRRVTDSYNWVEVDILVAEAEAAMEHGDTARAEAVVGRAVDSAAKCRLDGLLERALHVRSQLVG